MAFNNKYQSYVCTHPFHSYVSQSQVFISTVALSPFLNAPNSVFSQTSSKIAGEDDMCLLPRQIMIMMIFYNFVMCVSLFCCRVSFFTLYNPRVILWCGRKKGWRRRLFLPISMAFCFQVVNPTNGSVILHTCFCLVPVPSKNSIYIFHETFFYLWCV